MRYTNKQLAETLVDLAQKEDVQVATDALVHLLASQGQLHRVRDLAQTIEQVWKERFGAATITVETVHPLKAEILKKLEAIAQGAEVKQVIDPELIGGARIRIDDRIIDGSLSGALQNLKMTLLN